MTHKTDKQKDRTDFFKVFILQSLAAFVSGLAAYYVIMGYDATAISFAIGGSVWAILSFIGEVNQRR